MVRETKSFIHGFIRYPFLLFVSIVLMADLIIYLVVRSLVYAYEQSIVQGKIKNLLKLLLSSGTYQDYCKISSLIDDHIGATKWKSQEPSKLYDFVLIHELLNDLKSSMADLDVEHCRNIIIRSACKPNVANIEIEELYSRSFIGTKKLIETFQLTLLEAVRFVHANIEDKDEFLDKIDQLYGRSALYLSGGAMNCVYHVGLIKALFENNCLPSVLSGTSGGALFGSVLATWKDEELHEFFDPSFHTYFTPCHESSFIKLKRFITEGVLFKEELWIEEVRSLYGDLTFLEAFIRTGRTWNISVVSENGLNKLLNHLNAPDVLIWSAVLASSALPGILHPFQLMMKSNRNATNRYSLNSKEIRAHPRDALVKVENIYLVPFTGWGKTFRDGSLRMDIPREIHQTFNINFTIVSQVNPHVLPFFYNHKGSAGTPAIHRSGSGWRGGYLLSWWEHVIKLDLRKWLRVTCDLQMLPSILEEFEEIWLQKFHGSSTITPSFNIFDLFFLLTDPSEARYEKMTNMAELRTWPHVRRIKDRMALESLLDELRGNAKKNSKHNDFYKMEEHSKLRSRRYSSVN